MTLNRNFVRKGVLKTIFSKIILIFLILSPVIIFFGLSPLLYLNDPDANAPWVSWFNDPHQRVYICWETEDEEKGYIKFGTEQSNLDQYKFEGTKTLIHHVILEGLKADTLYYYQVIIDEELFGEGQFRTAPVIQKEFTFGMISDTQQSLGPGHHSRVAQVLDKKDYAFITNVGDLVDTGYEKQQYNNFFTVASTYFDTIPFVPVKGNHDNYRDKNNNKPNLFNDYYINRVNKSQEFFYYSFNYSNVHFQISHFPYGRQSEMTPDQMNWIEQDLKNAKDMSFKVCLFHCPIFGASYFGRSQDLNEFVLPIFEKYNVSAVISGHEHHFERGHINNVMYMILGGGGGPLDVGLRPLPETEVLTEVPCYTEVTATDTSLKFKTFTLQNDLIDDYTIFSDGGVTE